jgi:hypothetical protein
MERATKEDIIFRIIEKYYQANKKIDKSGLHEHLISEGFDLSEKVLEERIKHFKDETSKDVKEKNKNS